MWSLGYGGIQPNGRCELCHSSAVTERSRKCRVWLCGATAVHPPPCKRRHCRRAGLRVSSLARATTSTSASLCSHLPGRSEGCPSHASVCH
eukprot:2218104-Prymnesium_polylepis.1